MELRVTGLGGEPYWVVKPNGELAGYELDAIKIMIDKLGAKLKVEHAIDWINVKKDPNGDIELDTDKNPILIGCLPEVKYQKATFAVAEIIFIEDFYFMADYIVHTHQYLHFRSVRSKVLAPTWNLVKPFSSTAWILISVTLIILTIFFMGFTKISNLVHNKHDKHGILTIYKHQLSQNTLLRGKHMKVSMKIFLASFYVYAFMIHAFYDCNFRAYLMITEFEPVADTAKDIYEQVQRCPLITDNA